MISSYNLAAIKWDIQIQIKYQNIIQIQNYEKNLLQKQLINVGRNKIIKENNDDDKKQNDEIEIQQEIIKKKEKKKKTENRIILMIII